ncbi:hypothetical protein D3C81_2149510 [compost metagenome]
MELLHRTHRILQRQMLQSGDAKNRIKTLVLIGKRREISLCQMQLGCPPCLNLTCRILPDIIGDVLYNGFP